MTKDCGAFWTCRGTFGKTCSLTTKVVYWTFTLVIRPLLTNGFTVWWPGVTYKVSRPELSRLHRLASLAITGVMRMASAAVVEVVLVLRPLNVMTEAEAQAEINRLMCSKQWRSKSTNYGNGRKSWDIAHEPFLQMWTDRMLPSYAYDKPFTVTFSNSVSGKRG